MGFRKRQNNETKPKRGFFLDTDTGTSGYGNDFPSSTASKLFMIGYALLGIPLAGLTLASTSDYLSSHLLTLYRRQRRSRGGDAPAAAVAVAAAAFLVPGLALLLFAPAAVFAAVESWSYVDAFYYSFVTLTTSVLSFFLSFSLSLAPLASAIEFS